ncbi:MAG: helix-turn-helix domain-containing protein [Xanthobacteraceae bacterium]
MPLCGTMTGMGRSTENRSLDRGLDILNSLSVHGASSLRDIHAHTGLPKSTIRRLLGTLIRRKIVRRSLSDQRYRANISLPLQDNAEIAPREGWLVDCAVPHMIELTRSVGWACDLHMFERNCSRVIESTRPLSPYFQYERQIDLEVSVFASAGGLAVLSTWADAAVLALVDEVGDDSARGLARLGMSKRDLLATLRHIRALGYAVRVSQYRGETAMANKLNAIARAVLHNGIAVGALVILWPREFLGSARFAEIYLSGLKEAAARISTDLTSIHQRYDATDAPTRMAREAQPAERGP